MPRRKPPTVETILGDIANLTNEDRLQLFLQLWLTKGYRYHLQLAQSNASSPVAPPANQFKAAGLKCKDLGELVPLTVSEFMKIVQAKTKAQLTFQWSRKPEARYFNLGARIDCVHQAAAAAVNNRGVWDEVTLYIWNHREQYRQQYSLPAVRKHLSATQLTAEGRKKLTEYLKKARRDFRAHWSKMERLVE